MRVTMLAASDIEVTETTTVALMLVAALVAIAVSRLRVPYTVALVLVGLGLGLSGAFGAVDLTSDLILLVFLPPLLFEGALNMDVGILRTRRRQVAVLAIAGTLVSAVMIAAPLVIVPGMAMELAAVLAVMLAPTDPVSVLAVFKENGVGAGLRTLMEGESIFNDALAIVLYIIAVDVAFGEGSLTPQHIAGEFMIEISVGLAAGIGVGLLAHRLMATLDDHLVEITLSLVTAYGAYILADRFGGSGVIAVVIAGLLIGNYGTRRAMSVSSRVIMTEFWEVLAFLANSALFLVIGLEFHVSDMRGRTLVATIVAVLAMLAARAVIAFGLLLPFRRSAGAPVPTTWRVAAFWGGLRGSIPIALVLGLPERRFAGIDAVPVVFGVVLFSLVVQGLTFRPLLDRLGLTGGGADTPSYEEIVGRILALRAAGAELDQMRRCGDIAPAVFAELHGDVIVELERWDRELAGLSPTEPAPRGRQVRRARRHLISVQQDALAAAVRSGQISDIVARELSADIEEAQDDIDDMDDIDEWTASTTSTVVGLTATIAVHRRGSSAAPPRRDHHRSPARAQERRCAQPADRLGVGGGTEVRSVGEEAIHDDHSEHSTHRVRRPRDRRRTGWDRHRDHPRPARDPRRAPARAGAGARGHLVQQPLPGAGVRHLR